jgi:drug/metabolite transporter (DMT)-like permease
MTRTWPAHLALIGANLLYGVNYAIAKYPMPDYVKPAGFVLIRVVVGGLLFWLLHALVISERIRRRDIPLFMMCGLFGVAANQLMFISGLNLTTEINASLIMITTPVLVPLLAHFIIHDRVGLQSMIGIALGATGAFMLIAFGQDLEFGSHTWRGDLLIFLNAASWALYLVIAKPLLRRYNTVTVIKWTFIFGFFIITIFGIPAILDVDLRAWDWRVWASIGFVVIGATFLAYLFNIFGLSRLSPSVVGIYIYSQPFIASLLAMFISSDRLTLTKIIAAVLIFTGVMLVSGIGPFRNKAEDANQSATE